MNKKYIVEVKLFMQHMKEVEARKRSRKANKPLKWDDERFGGDALRLMNRG